MKTKTYADPNDAPEAYRVQWFKCDECENLHLALVDENLRFIAMANVSRPMIEQMLKTIDEPPAGLIQ